MKIPIPQPAHSLLAACGNWHVGLRRTAWTLTLYRTCIIRFSM